MRGQWRTPTAKLLMRSSIKRFFSRWKLDNIKVVRRVIVSVFGATIY